MKQTIFTLLLLSTIGMVSCRKVGTEPTIVQYDQSQITNYIKTNNITGMKQDTVGGDTSGIYYKVIQQGTGDPLTYSDQISFVFTLRSFDGLYSSTDTISNHYFGYVGAVTGSALPLGLEIAILNDLKYSGGSARILIPSNLAYGVTGYGSGSINNPGSHIAGNQCLDYYVHVISSEKNIVYGTNTLGVQYSYNSAQSIYDEQVIENYIKTSGLTFTKAPSINLPGTHYYYSIRVPGTGTDSINQNSTITTNLAGRTLNNDFFDIASNPIADTTVVDVPDLPLGTQEALTHITTGGTISFILPSALCFGTELASTSGVSTNSCIRYEFEIKRVSP